MYILFDKSFIIRAISDKPISSPNLIGNKVGESRSFKTNSDLRVAIICNWNDQCGISTYSGFLVNAIIPQVKEVKVFSEVVPNKTFNDETFVERCWQRGKSLLDLSKRVIDWNPDLVIIQHEYGIFPNAFYWMQLMQKIENIPSVITLHSVYDHLDKVVYNESIKNVVVHSDSAKNMLQDLGSTSNIFVIPHGCVNFAETDELWNIFLNPYTVMQFGFGFEYKGVDRALRAISHLKHTDPKFANIFYVYLCSTNKHNNLSHNAYYDSLLKLIEDLKIEENVTILRKYQTDKMLNLYIRLSRIAIFPYIVDENNKIRSASGAIRVAMANKRPVIASESGHFDDLEGLIPRPSNHIELAREIDEIFSNDQYRNTNIENGQKFINDNNWVKCSEQYLNIYNKILPSY
jgi:glycosyltransferase involved in cell wall biosynthesis